ncbi:carboxymuconolactone decarboxylase family protein [Paracoccus limosus]|jgi:AhpD family alkylhydroperoxidase|uniref:Carboxymuconolactone decarboxylase family protein n=1 Tax=Paracoccus limosus TaxID=913252 RepID=A0A844GZ90_9RHOB|nr:carboxymuconolactone decarboxylase family protein [Paracoccus limosus]MTH33115.1 carboxymuconolactone decarboxylase family protein [Paracoccus limosus]
MDWKDFREDLLGRIGTLNGYAPDSVGAYMQASGAGRKSGHLDEKTRQLISLAVAVTTRCDGCISVHAREAVSAGATKEEIAEALGVAMSMNMGAALVYSSRAFEAAEQFGASGK